MPTHHVFCTYEVGLENQVIWDAASGCLALAFEPEVLDLNSYVFISSTSVHIVVEVMLPRSHCAKSERETCFARRDQAINVVRKGDDTGGDLQVEVCKGPPCATSARGDRFEEQGCMLWYKCSPKPAVALYRILFPPMDIRAF